MGTVEVHMVYKTLHLMKVKEALKAVFLVSPLAFFALLFWLSTLKRQIRYHLYGLPQQCSSKWTGCLRLLKDSKGETLQIMSVKKVHIFRSTYAYLVHPSKAITKRFSNVAMMISFYFLPWICLPYYIYKVCTCTLLYFIISIIVHRQKLFTIVKRKMTVQL